MKLGSIIQLPSNSTLPLVGLQHMQQCQVNFLHFLLPATEMFKIKRGTFASKHFKGNEWTTRPVLCGRDPRTSPQRIPQDGAHHPRNLRARSNKHEGHPLPLAQTGTICPLVSPRICTNRNSAWWPSTTSPTTATTTSTMSTVSQRQPSKLAQPHSTPEHHDRS